MQRIGVVISTPSPTSNKFFFLVDYGKNVNKGQFVQLKLENSLLVGRVVEVIKTNRYFFKAESLLEYTKEEGRLENLFPIDKWEYLVAECASLGSFHEATWRRSSIPPSPGQEVFLAENSTLSNFFGLKENGLNLGKLEFHDLDVKLDITKLFQKHLAILAISGAGKSYTASVLIEEILDRPEEEGKPAIIVIDPHGEYVGFEKDERYSKFTKVFRKNEISIGVYNLSTWKIAELLPQISPVQRRELAPIVEKMRKRKTTYTLDELIEEIEKSDMNPKTKVALAAWISELNSTNLFKKLDSPSIEELAKPGQLSILDLSDFVHLQERQIVVTYFGRRLFELRREKKIPPFILFVEEAHQFAPGMEVEELAISRGLIEQIAREGRKFNACLVLISQRPKRLSITALSQCNTQIIMRITNPIDLRHIEEGSEGITKDVLDIIPGLRVGEALIVGEAVNYPILVRVRRRKSKSLESGIRLEDEIKNFRMSEDDLNAFINYENR